MWIAICLTLALFIATVEPRIGWRVFLLGFFLAQIYLYGRMRRDEALHPSQPQGENKESKL